MQKTSSLEDLNLCQFGTTKGFLQRPKCEKNLFLWQQKMIQFQNSTFQTNKNFRNPKFFLDPLVWLKSESAIKISMDSICSWWKSFWENFNILVLELARPILMKGYNRQLTYKLITNVIQQNHICIISFPHI